MVEMEEEGNVFVFEGGLICCSFVLFLKVF